MRRGLVAVAAALVAVVGCGAEDDGDVIIDYGPAVTPYSGPLHIETEKVNGDTPDAMLLASGGAGRALECKGEISRGGAPDGWGRGDGGRTPEDGLRLYFRLFEPGGLPSKFRVEREETDRVLYSHRVDGRTKTAVVVAKDQEGRPGWGPESYASCYPARRASPTPATRRSGPTGAASGSQPRH
ncbi:hypothetical protein [Streptomyces scabiei]|uniref:hypothetical protein n=1 Tax=Streptomyces scabiei TaxID=1930 RepID=UPI000765F29A|nr:hypothetical protein [Streptomyces scabiei]